MKQNPCVKLMFCSFECHFYRKLKLILVSVANSSSELCIWKRNILNNDIVLVFPSQQILCVCSVQFSWSYKKKYELMDTVTNILLDCWHTKCIIPGIFILDYGFALDTVYFTSSSFPCVQILTFSITLNIVIVNV